jgi:uncharacterized protein YlzI (FlbEa/FlbD family)
MIVCSDLQGRPCYINPDLLERIEVTPDTQLIFVNGRRMYVAETPAEIITRIVTFRRSIGGGTGSQAWLSETMPEVEE